MRSFQVSDSVYSVDIVILFIDCSSHKGRVILLKGDHLLSCRYEDGIRGLVAQPDRCSCGLRSTCYEHLSSVIFPAMVSLCKSLTEFLLKVIDAMTSESPLSYCDTLYLTWFIFRKMKLNFQLYSLVGFQECLILSFFVQTKTITWYPGGALLLSFCLTAKWSPERYSERHQHNYQTSPKYPPKMTTVSNRCFKKPLSKWWNLVFLHPNGLQMNWSISC